MNEAPIQYQWSDAWVLLSVIYASRDGPATLVEIIQMGDAINRAIFTDRELQSGFFRLTEGGWLIGTDDAWLASEKAINEYTRIEQRRLSPYDSMQEFRKVLGAPGWAPETNAKNPADIYEFPGLTNSRITKACKDYTRGFWKAYKKLKESES